MTQARNVFWRSFDRSCLAASWILLIGTTACYLGAWDGAAALTVFPQWAWALVGGIAVYLSCRISRWRWRHSVLAALWFCSVLFFSDNLIPMLRDVRGASQASRPAGVRVITLNCAGNLEAVLEAAAFQPDILLLQEIPPASSLVIAASKMGVTTNGLICGFDCAILVKGHVIQAQPSFPSHYIQGRVKLQSGAELFVTSLRLVPPEGRIDLWNPRAWRSAAENRRVRHAQLQEALPEKNLTLREPEVLGGDFNAPAGDAVYRLLTEYEDSHRNAGKGWGNTALNNFPIARPDQIRVRNARVLSCRAVPTRNSDHRMVIAEIQLPASRR